MMQTMAKFEKLLYLMNVIVHIAIVLSFQLGLIIYTAAQNLDPNFYSTTCPNVVSIASSTYQSLARSNNVVSPATLRLINHDCFIQGCDASILISSTSENKAERDYVENDLPQQAFDTINRMKQAVDAVCPGVVSCADLVVIAAEEAVRFLGGPTWQVALGRRDSLTSLASNSPGNIPPSNLDIDGLISLFASKGLNIQDLVALSGAHTIGFSKCRQFAFRFSSPNMDPNFVRQLQQQCPTNANDLDVVAFDPNSPFTFDTSYFSDLQANKGLLQTDQELFQDSRTRSLVDRFAASQREFFVAFVEGMMKMSSIGVLTGNQGEIRRDCTRFNS